jgi:hypothetical protein
VPVFDHTRGDANANTEINSKLIGDWQHQSCSTIKPHNLTPKMKPFLLIAFLALATTTLSAAAATDRSYYVTELAAQQKFDVYNDGRNTYLESIPGLVVTGATADGERYIVDGVPQQIRGFMNGKPITIVRGIPPLPKPAAPDAAAVNAQIKQLTEKLDSLSSKVQPKTTQPVQVAVASTGAAGGAARIPASAAAVVATTGFRPGDKVASVPAAARFISATEKIKWHVDPRDQNLRLLIDRWTAFVGWTAVWDVDRDIPISTGDEYVGDFKSAVRRVLSSTELSDVQLKPCFYSNSVVRVVRKTAKCNPNE